MVLNLNAGLIDPCTISRIDTEYYKNIFPKSNRKIFFYTPIPTSQGPQIYESFADPETGDRGPWERVDSAPVFPKTRPPVPDEENNK